MTEAEWLAATDPEPMLEFLRGKASDRKLRLFACSCCRRIWHCFSDNRSRWAVMVAEQYADGTATEDELNRAERAANSVRSNQDDYYFNAADAAWDAVKLRPDPNDAADAATAVLAQERINKESDLCYDDAFSWEAVGLSALLRDIFGNPFRPPSVDPAWLTSTVLALARQMYDARDFALIPILADALQDAGCDSDDILAHCRGDGPHVRGCWVVDLLLGKE
ncbi:hypothetical protein [Fimbriiglobus ruber]|uniref:hypothetical protein n=1 Tax=Fimbriiglobus ruber TaxID=1908690 RepID=UPI001EE6D609|nr:hypothetical protein [Fimbriiglobus ruber]